MCWEGEAMAFKTMTTDATRGAVGPVAVSYDQDVVAWSVEQARLLRAGRFDRLDIEHIADEIEDVGRSQARDLASRLAMLLAHWLRWEYHPAHRSRSWKTRYASSASRFCGAWRELQVCAPSWGKRTLSRTSGAMR